MLLISRQWQNIIEQLSTGIINCLSLEIRKCNGSNQAAEWDSGRGSPSYGALQAWLSIFLKEMPSLTSTENFLDNIR